MPQQQVEGRTMSFQEETGGALDGKEGFFLKLGATPGTVALAGAAEEIFVMDQKLQRGSDPTNATVTVSTLNAGGSFHVVCGGAVAYAATVTSDAAGAAVAGVGKLISISPDAVAGEFIEVVVA